MENIGKFYTLTGAMKSAVSTNAMRTNEGVLTRGPKLHHDHGTGERLRVRKMNGSDGGYIIADSKSHAGLMPGEKYVVFNE